MLAMQRRYQLLGLGAGLLLVLAAYFLLISPQQDSTSSVRDQISNVQSSNVVLQTRTTKLAGDFKHLSEYKAQLAIDQAALPADPQITSFINQLQSSASDARVSITSISTANETAVASVAGTYQIPITVMVTGTADELQSYLNQLQRQQPRGALITSADIHANGGGNSDISGPCTLQISMSIFVSPGGK